MTRLRSELTVLREYARDAGIVLILGLALLGVFAIAEVILT